MALDSIPLFTVLKSKMNWHQSRQTLLAQNVANADTPGYKGSDLADFKVERAVRSGQQILPPSWRDTDQFSAHRRQGNG